MIAFDRVLHGFGDSAGQPRTLSRALRSQGFRSENAVVGARHPFGYEADIVSGARGDREKVAFLSSIVNDFDIFHFHVSSLLRGEGLGRRKFASRGLDLLALRAQNKGVFFHFRGSEVRYPSAFSRQAFNYVAENPNSIFSRISETSQIAFRDFTKAVCTRVFVPDPELLTYVPGAFIVPRALSLDKWKVVGQTNRQVPLVVHAPSNQTIKGTKFVLEAVASLRREGLQFEFKLLEKMPNEEVKSWLESADVVIDQLRIGWYGVLAVEAMALGKPTLVFIRQDISGTLGPRRPLFETDPTRIASDLKELILRPQLRREIGVEARAYVERVHSEESVGALLSGYYRDALSEKKEVDVRRILDYITTPQERSHFKTVPPLKEWRRLLLSRL